MDSLWWHVVGCSNCKNIVKRSNEIITPPPDIYHFTNERQSGPQCRVQISSDNYRTEWVGCSCLWAEEPTQPQVSQLHYCWGCHKYIGWLDVCVKGWVVCNVTLGGGEKTTHAGVAIATRHSPLCMTLLECMCSNALHSCTKYLLCMCMHCVYMRGRWHCTD